MSTLDTRTSLQADHGVEPSLLGDARSDRQPRAPRAGEPGGFVSAAAASPGDPAPPPVPSVAEPAPAIPPAAAPPATTALARRPNARYVAPRRRSDRIWDRIEAFISSLSVRDNFWASICSFIWLPLAFFSGIKMKKIDADTFTAVLPFRKFNRNWYNAMAGGALLANSEIAGGMYVFGICGNDYTVVCRQLEYKFLRPCVGPAVYRVTPRENIRELMAAGGEFNITVDMDITQQTFRPQDKDRRVGKCVAVFHVTPKQHHKARKLRQRQRD
ncbi:MAG: PaaI family thioesterase [Tepidisphaerales bacterium]